MDKLVSNMKIVVGLPTWREDWNIRSLTEKVDKRLCDLSVESTALIVNADNNSPDRTVEEFLAANTQCEKVSLLTEKGLRGKGYNMRLLFGYALEKKADILINIDADLEHVGEDWIPTMCRAIVEEQADLFVPVYPRYWYDANQTNQIMTPLVSAVTGVSVRQPTAGDFAFSPKFIKHLLDITWPVGAFGFGADLFCLLKALQDGFAISQEPLSIGKLHSWRSDDEDQLEDEMLDKFEAMVGTVLMQLAGGSWNQQGVPVKFPKNGAFKYPPKDYDPSHIIRAAENQFQSVRDNLVFQELMGEVPSSSGMPALKNQQWAQILYRCFQKAKANSLDPDFYSYFKILFYMRMASVLPKLTDDGVEPMVLEVTEFLRELILQQAAEEKESRKEVG